MYATQIIVRGLVQGVYFRVGMKEVADDLGITGWVRNTDDEAVEIHAEGSEEALKQLEEWCWNGPPRAEVKNVERKAVAAENCHGFEIIQ